MSRKHYLLAVVLVCSFLVSIPIGVNAGSFGFWTKKPIRTEKRKQVQKNGKPLSPKKDEGGSIKKSGRRDLTPVEKVDAKPVGEGEGTVEEISLLERMNYTLVAAGRSTFDLIERDFQEGVITASEYFLQKLYFVIGTDRLHEKRFERYRQNADSGADARNRSGTAVLSEMKQYLNNPDADPEAAAGINAFFSPLVLRSEPGATYLVAPTTVTGCSSEDYCKFPSAATRRAINSSTIDMPPAEGIEKYVDDFIEAHLAILYDAANVNGCICAQADSNTVVEVYYNTGTPNASNTAVLIANYLETTLERGKKPWPAIRDHTYALPTPDPRPIFDMSRRPDATRRWQITDTSSSNRPYQIYVTSLSSDLGFVQQFNADRGGSVLFIKARSPSKNVEVSVEGRTQVPDTILAINMMKGTVIHELFHVFAEQLWSIHNFNHADLYDEGLATAMEGVIDTNINSELIWDADFLEDKVGVNIYELTGRKGYPLSIFFRYLFSLFEKSGGAGYPFHQYLLGHRGMDSKTIMRSLLLEHGAQFAASNLNIDYDLLNENIFGYNYYDIEYFKGLSVPHKYLDTNQEEFVCGTNDVNANVLLPNLNSGQTSYNLVSLKGERKNNRFLKIKHSNFTKNPDTKLGVLLIHADVEIPNNSQDFDKYILGEINQKGIVSAKYHEYKGSDPDGEICLEEEGERPNLIMFIAVNNAQNAIEFPSITEVSICTTCDPLGSGLVVRAAYECKGSYPTILGTSEVEQNYSQSYTIDSMEFEHEDMIHGDNSALGSKDGILASFKLVDAKIDIFEVNWAIITDPPLYTPPHCTAESHDTSKDIKIIRVNNLPLGEYIKDRFWRSHVRGRLTLYKDGNYTLSIFMQALGSVDSVRTYDCCHPSTSSRVEGIEPWETHVLRIHGTFENGATSLSGISTLPHVISRSMTGTVHGSPPGQICGGLDRLIDQVGDATVSWGIDIPAMWHCTHENGCLGPNDPVPTPPAYWELPLFCEQGTDYYDMVACGTWLTEVFEDDPNS